MQLSQYHPVFTKVVNRTLSSFLYQALGLFLLLLSHHSRCRRRFFGEMFKCISTHTVSVAFQWTFRFIVVEYTQLGLCFQCTTTTQRRHCVCSVSSCIYANRVYIYQESCVLVIFSTSFFSFCHSLYCSEYRHTLLFCTIAAAAAVIVVVAVCSRSVTFKRVVRRL